MPWPVPAPGDTAGRCAAIFEADLPAIWAAKNPGAPAATVDARSNTSVLAVYCRTVDAATQDLYYEQAGAVQELFPDTAVFDLARHGAIWGVPQVQASAAIGNAIFTEPPTANIPSGLAMTAGTQTYVTTASATVPSGGTISVPVACVTPGSIGSQPAGTILQLVSPQGGFTLQQAVVDSQGLIGQDAQSLQSWRSAILQRIRQRGQSGDAADFEGWVQEVYPTAIAHAFSPYIGEVTVAFAMPSGNSWRVPISSEINAVSAYVNDSTNRKPLGCGVVNVIGATLQPINFTLSLNPDTANNETAAQDALALQILADATIGGTLYMSRMDAALENASGEFSHDRLAPLGDTGALAGFLSVMGTVTF